MAKKTKAEKNAGKGPQEPPQSKETEKQSGSGEMDIVNLFDIAPEHVDEIKQRVTAYKKHQTTRLKALASEVVEKQAILALVNQDKLQRRPDGSIVFSCDETIISITPQDDKITVKKVSKAK